MNQVPVDMENVFYRIIKSENIVLKDELKIVILAMFDFEMINRVYKNEIDQFPRSQFYHPLIDLTKEFAHILVNHCKKKKRQEITAEDIQKASRQIHSICNFFPCSPGPGEENLL